MILFSILCMQCPFSLPSFKILSLSLVWLLCALLLFLHVFGDLLSILNLWSFNFFRIGKTFSFYFFRYIFLSLPFLSFGNLEFPKVAQQLWLMSFIPLFYFEWFLLLSSSLLIFPSTMSDLLLITASVFFSLDISVFFSVWVGPFVYFFCLYLTSLSLWTYGVHVIITHFVFADSVIYRIFLFTFLIIFNCMANFFFFLYFNEYSWVLFWEAIKVLGNNVILSDIAFKLCSVESEKKVVEDKFCLSAKTKAFWVFCSMCHEL